MLALRLLELCDVLLAAKVCLGFGVESSEVNPASKFAVANVGKLLEDLDVVHLRVERDTAGLLDREDLADFKFLPLRRSQQFTNGLSQLIEAPDGDAEGQPELLRDVAVLHVCQMLVHVIKHLCTVNQRHVACGGSKSLAPGLWEGNGKEQNVTT